MSREAPVKRERFVLLRNVLGTGGDSLRSLSIYIDVFSLASSVGPDQQRLLGLNQDFNRGTEKSFKLEIIVNTKAVCILGPLSSESK